MCSKTGAYTSFRLNKVGALGVRVITLKNEHLLAIWKDGWNKTEDILYFRVKALKTGVCYRPDSRALFPFNFRSDGVFSTEINTETSFVIQKGHARSYDVINTLFGLYLGNYSVYLGHTLGHAWPLEITEQFGLGFVTSSPTTSSIHVLAYISGTTQWILTILSMRDL